MNNDSHRIALALVTQALVLLFLLPGCRTHEPVVMVSAGLEAQDDAALFLKAIKERPRAAAIAVLASLDADKREQVNRPIADPLRKDWHFIPRPRQGLMLGDMSIQQKTLVHQLMQTALSDAGYLKATDIIWLETVLYEMSNQNPMRDPGKYALVIFGDPADDNAAWGWRLEGHHLSINLTYTAEGIGVTPLFFGTNPAVVPIGPLAGKRILADAHNLAVELANSMNDEQRKKMMLAEKPRDVITGPGRESALQEPTGIAMAELGPSASGLIKLIQVHLNSFEDRHRSGLLASVFARPGGAGAGDTYMAWAGPIDADKPFYYRIHNKHFVIEYSCQGRNHVHAVLHDLTDPLQEDLLKKHFEQHEHE